MKSSVYISSEKIEVIGYIKAGKKVSIKDYVAYPLPEGIMINGKIFDHGNLSEELTALRTKHPDLLEEPVLVVDGSSILSKRMPVPKLNKRLYNQMVREEFTETVENPENLVCAYHPLASVQGSPPAILACATDKEQVESYISVFKEAGIKLGAVHIGVQAILHYVASRADLQKKTFVLNIIDGVTMLSMIFNEGVNVFMSRSRLYGDEHEELLQNILDNLFGLIQFNKSEKFNDFTVSYYLGLTEDDVRFMSEISHYPDITLEAFSLYHGLEGTGNFDKQTHFSYLNTLLEDNSIDLIRSYKALEKLQKQQKPKKWWIPVLAGIAVLVAVPIVLLQVGIASGNVLIKEVTDYLNDETIVSRSEEIDRIVSETSFYARINAQLLQRDEDILNTPTVTNEVLDLITKTMTGTVTVSQFDFNEDTGIIRVSAACKTETDAAKYVDALKKSDPVKGVHYTGYSYNNEQEFTFSIDVELAVIGTEGVEG